MMSPRIPLLLSILFFPLLSSAESCNPAEGSKNFQALVALDFCKFDQTRGEGWQSIKGPPICQTFAMEAFVRSHDRKLQDMQKATVLVHLAHAYAMAGKNGRSLSTLQRIRTDSDLPADFALFVKAQIAYMKHQPKEFEAYRVQLRDLNGLCSEKSACGGAAPKCNPSGESSYYGPVERLKECFDDKPRALKVMWESSIQCHGEITITGAIAPASTSRVCSL